jgi:hypothetical protein
MNTKNLAYWYLLIGAVYGLTERTIDLAKQGFTPLEIGTIAVIVFTLVCIICVRPYD